MRYKTRFSNSLKYILERRIATLAQQKWLIKLLGYLFVVEYKRVYKNKVADALSRRAELVSEDPSSNPSASSSSFFLISFPCPS